MPLILTVPDEIAQAAEAMARNSGVSAERLLLDALHARFPAVPPELQAEFAAWEQASDEDFARFESVESPGKP